MKEESREPTAAQSAFEMETQNIPAEITDNQDQNAGPAAAAGAPQVEGWTAENVAEQFSGIFMFLEVVRGPHWHVAPGSAQRLGGAFLPIFQRHVPFGTGAPSWLGDAMMWIGALGALKEVAGPAIKKEIEMLRAKKQKPGQVNDSPSSPTPEASSRESMQTVTSADSSSSQESAEVASHFSSSESLEPARLEF